MVAGADGRKIVSSRVSPEFGVRIPNSYDHRLIEFLIENNPDGPEMEPLREIRDRLRTQAKE